MGGADVVAGEKTLGVGGAGVVGGKKPSAKRCLLKARQVLQRSGGHWGFFCYLNLGREEEK